MYINSGGGAVKYGVCVYNRMACQQMILENESKKQHNSKEKNKKIGRIWQHWIKIYTSNSYILECCCCCFLHIFTI